MAAVETLRDLQPFVPHEDLQVAYVTGYSQFNDGGGGHFVYRSNSSVNPVSGSLDGMIVVPANNVGRWHRVWHGGPLNILQFGGTSVMADCTTALNQALLYASYPNPLPGAGKTIEFPAGHYVFKSKPNDMRCGVVLAGHGSQGSTLQIGTTFTADYASDGEDEAFLKFLGNSGQNTGGGIRNVSIHAGAGFKSNLVMLSCLGGPVSWWTAEHVLLNAAGYARRCFLAKDSTGSGNRGVRDINLYNVYACGATKVNETLSFWDAANVFLIGGFVYKAGGTVEEGVTFDGSLGVGCAMARINGMATGGKIKPNKITGLLVDGVPW